MVLGFLEFLGAPAFRLSRAVLESIGLVGPEFRAVPELVLAKAETASELQQGSRPADKVPADRVAALEPAFEAESAASFVVVE